MGDFCRAMRILQHKFSCNCLFTYVTKTQKSQALRLPRYFIKAQKLLLKLSEAYKSFALHGSKKLCKSALRHKKHCVSSFFARARRGRRKSKGSGAPRDIPEGRRFLFTTSQIYFTLIVNP